MKTNTSHLFATNTVPVFGSIVIALGEEHTDIGSPIGLQSVSLIINTVPLFSFAIIRIRKDTRLLKLNRYSKSNSKSTTSIQSWTGYNRSGKPI